MLSERQKEYQFARTAEEVARLEVELLSLAARTVSSLDSLDVYDIARSSGALVVDAFNLTKRRERAVQNAVRADLRTAFEKDAANELTRASMALDGVTAASAASVSAPFARDAYAEAAPVVQRLLSQAPSDLLSAYVQSSERAAVRVSTVGTREAMREAVTNLARNGITHYSYTRSNGTRVNVPIDVGIRKAVINAGQRGRMAQTLQIATDLGQDLVEVSTTANPRISHAIWEGKIYSMTGRTSGYEVFANACNVGDPVNGIGGYNCGHEVAIYYPGYSRTFKDPLEGTGYTKEEARELNAEQRALEREVRAAKREAAALKAGGFSTSEANARAREAQAEIRRLVDENPILYRQRSREQLYGS